MPWRQAAFTTYSLSLSFFEAVVLDALVRGGGPRPLILSDVAGVQAALMEQGARRAGRDYQVEPISVTGGVFHAKISAFTTDDDCHLLIGSGNLTFGGWGGNLEVCEHIHPSFAAHAISDASEFFEYLAVIGDRFRHGAAERCAAIAENLMSAVRGRALNGDMRLLHNLEGAISVKLAEQIDGLGGAERLVVASPFWDGGGAIERLTKLVGLDEVFVHSHPHKTVEGRAGANWPSRGTGNVRAIRLEALEDEKKRRLHAKVFEVICRRGRILMSGSANATWAALEAGHNVEACIVRIQRERAVGWRFSAAEPPEPNPARDEETEDRESMAGVLRAELVIDHVVGQVLTPRMSGTASAFQIGSGVPTPMGNADIGEDGSFKIPAPDLEIEAWKGVRLAVRLQTADGKRSEGFVSVAAYASIARRAGALATRLMSVIAGTETPADVAAIFSWFNEDPRRLVDTPNTRIGGGSGAPEIVEGRTIPIVELNPAFAAVAGPVGGDTASKEVIGWQRFMAQVLAAFRERRAPFSGDGGNRPGDDEDGDDDPKSDDDQMAVDPAAEQALSNFESLFELMLNAENEARYAIAAYELTRYVCERLKPEPDRVKRWLGELVHAMSRVACPPEMRKEIAAAILALMGEGPFDGPALRKTRARLLNIGIDLAGPAPSQEHAHEFQGLMLEGVSFDDLWLQIRKVRTFGEQANIYLEALRRCEMPESHLDFETAVPEEWATLRKALVSESTRSRILVVTKPQDACPGLRCYMELPRIEKGKLRSLHVATCRSCGRVIVCEG